MKEPECREIYREAFSDPDTAFEDALFGHCFRYVKTVEEAGRVVSMLFALPCVIRTENTETDAVYVYAVATKKTERGKGHMHRLFEEIKREYKTFFLVPARKELIGFYRTCGLFEFEASNYETGQARVLPKGGFAELIGESKPAKKERFSAMGFTETPLTLEGLYFPCRME